MNFTLTQDQYTALVALARKGAPDPVALEQFLVQIEKANGVNRYLLWVRWQEADVTPKSDVRFPKTWPPTQEYLLEKLSPITKQDVLDALAVNATNPVTVLVTVDPAKEVGWQPLADRFQ